MGRTRNQATRILQLACSTGGTAVIAMSWSAGGDWLLSDGHPERENNQVLAEAPSANVSNSLGSVARGASGRVMLPTPDHRLIKRSRSPFPLCQNGCPNDCLPISDRMSPFPIL